MSQSGACRQNPSDNNNKKTGMFIYGFMHEYVSSGLLNWKAASYWFFFTLVGFLIIYIF